MLQDLLINLVIMLRDVLGGTAMVFLWYDFFPVCYSAHWLYSVVYGVFNVVIIKEGDTAFLMFNSLIVITHIQYQSKVS